MTPWLYALTLYQPMSSPKITRMFGRRDRTARAGPQAANTTTQAIALLRRIDPA
jgi:hypothetical protein